MPFLHFFLIVCILFFFEVETYPSLRVQFINLSEQKKQAKLVYEGLSRLKDSVGVEDYYHCKPFPPSFFLSGGK